MKLAPAIALLALALIPLAPHQAEAHSAPGGYGVEVVVGGWSAREYAAQGRRYVEAEEGVEYTVRLTNPTGRRVAVALSIDGLNTIDARHTSAREAAKWVIAPYETIEIRGWQTSSDTQRAFYFTSEPGSYGAWLGDTDNLGVIEAAFFPEVVRTTYDEEITRSDKRRRAPAGGNGAQGSAAPAPTAERSAAEGLSADLAATGIGREGRNAVTQVRMELEDRPAAVVSLRYEYHDALVRLGVLPREVRPLERRERAQGFAPDPYRLEW